MHEETECFFSDFNNNVVYCQKRFLSSCECSKAKRNLYIKAISNSYLSFVFLYVVLYFDASECIDLGAPGRKNGFKILRVKNELITVAFAYG